MALRNQPYIPLYVEDYLTDEKLNMCSAAAQGIYIKILCVFHKSETYGGIMLKPRDWGGECDAPNLRSICDKFAIKLAKLLTFQYDEIRSALIELVEEGVLQIDGNFLYQKRMVRDNEISLKRSNSGKKGNLARWSIDQPIIANSSQNISQNHRKHNRKSIANSENEYENENESENEFENESKFKYIYPEDFENFWKVYPKKIGKGGAFKVWKKIRPGKELQKQIIEAIEKQSQSERWKAENGRFIPNPQTWLSQARWDDEISETRSASYGID